MIPIIDSHLDIAWNALGWNRDLTASLEQIRNREKSMTDHRARSKGVITLEEMRRGGIKIALGTLLACANPIASRTDRRDLDFVNQTVASAQARGQLAYYQLLQDQNEIKILKNAADLEAHWKTACGFAGPQSPIGIIIAMEGADPIVTPHRAEDWFEAGLRVVGLAHYGKSAYAVGTGDSGPLTPRGIELLKRFDRIGMILDLTHSSDPSFFQALDLFHGAVLASHNNCRALVPGDRQFSDEQIALLLQRDAVIGVALDSWMLLPNYRCGQTPKEAVTLEHVADHIDHICQLAGNADHAAIGSDLDGGFGYEQTPKEIDSIADLQRLAPILRSRGYGQPDIEKIFHANWLRFFSTHLPQD